MGCRWQRVAMEVREVIVRLGPTFIKVGQALGSRPDIVGPEGIRQLQLLLDNVPSFSSDRARALIREDLPSTPQAEALLATISAQPVAAASIGQVYSAEVGGRRVAVKVQRPGIRETVALDFFLARNAGGAATALLGVRSDVVGGIDEFASRLFEEMDYKREADNMEQFKALYGAGGSAKMDDILVPDCRRDLSSSRVITSEWIDGDRLIDSDAVVSAADLPLVNLGIRCTLSQLLQTGFLHADPHAGNLLKCPDGKLAYLDFGIVSTVPSLVQESLICAVIHLLNRDYKALAKDFDGLMLMNADDLEVDFEEFATNLGGAASKVLDFGSTEGGSRVPTLRFDTLVDTLVGLAADFAFVLPPYFLNNVRAIGMLEGLALSADPRFNILDVVVPYVATRMLTDPSPRLNQGLREVAVRPDGCLNWENVRLLLFDALPGRTFAMQVERLKLIWRMLCSPNGPVVLRATFNLAVYTAWQYI
eukprot:gene6710-8030_t